MDSYTTATANRDELRLTPSKQDSFQSVDCTKCYQDNSFTSVVPASTEHHMAAQALTDEIRQRRDVVLHRSRRHQRYSVERRENPTDAVYTKSKACSVASTSQGDTDVRLRESTVSIRRVATESRSSFESNSSNNSSAASRTS